MFNPRFKKAARRYRGAFARQSLVYVSPGIISFWGFGIVAASGDEEDYQDCENDQSKAGTINGHDFAFWLKPIAESTGNERLGELALMYSNGPDAALCPEEHRCSLHRR